MALLTGVVLVLACLLAIFLIRRALPILCAAMTGWLAWSLTHDAGATGVVSVAALLVVCWVLDAAANHEHTRHLTIFVEIIGAALVAGGLTFLVVGGHGAHLVWMIAGASIAAAVIIARWREFSF